MQRKKVNLSALIDKIDWLMVEPVRGIIGLPYNAIAVSFYKSKPEKLHADKVLIRIGKDIVKELNWQNKDRIAIGHDPENILNFFMKNNGNCGSGYALTLEGSGPNYRINYTWRLQDEFKLSDMKLTRVNFEMARGCLVFNANDKFEEDIVTKYSN